MRDVTQNDIDKPAGPLLDRGMIKSLMPGVHLAVAGIVFCLCSTALRALEPRTWVIIDGRTVEAELKGVSGTQVTLLDTENRRINLDKSMLSFGDIDYINENSPPDKSSGFVPHSSSPPPLPNPAKQARIDPKLFVKNANTFSIDAYEPFQVLETPHFKIMYGKPVEPGDMAELAERLWVDTAFFHSTFGQKFRQRKMAVFMCPNDDTYNRVGTWYAELMTKSGNADNAAKITASWPKSGAGTVHLPRDIADQNGVLDEARVFRAYKPTSSASQRPEMVRGVLDPFRVHCLSGDLLRIQAGYVQQFGAKGYFAITTGHGYYKEILLTGRSDTALLSASVSASGSASVSSAGGFKDARNWAQELKRQIRKGDIKASLSSLFEATDDSANEKSNVLAYSFARYLQSTPERLSAFNKLIERISTSGQIPEPDDIAKIYGLADGKALEADWLKYVNSTDFH